MSISGIDNNVEPFLVWCRTFCWATGYDCHNMAYTFVWTDTSYKRSKSNSFSIIKTKLVSLCIF